ncbi:hypothetical protein ARMSODRAFT_805100 [Armillaria solidipes]|uniref:Uncharacterized protein n=1 Tax=Armillaria solidipes TaxID=1076256 RepID=A0A2H3ANL0_9AGAR|nr:hypothetical protein ARMSODRAFT_805100 [Armillaria solidipes]
MVVLDSVAGPKLGRLERGPSSPLMPRMDVDRWFICHLARKGATARISTSRTALVCIVSTYRWISSIMLIWHSWSPMQNRYLSHVTRCKCYELGTVRCVLSRKVNFFGTVHVHRVRAGILLQDRNQFLLRKFGCLGQKVSWVGKRLMTVLISK